jgi:hypothetical protein
VRLWLVEPVSGTSSQCVVVLLYNVSGPCSRFLCVSCHCVMDVLSCSVMVWWLMATWMNVFATVVARFFFFLCWPLQMSRACLSPRLFVGVLAICVFWIEGPMLAVVCCHVCILVC